MKDDVDNCRYWPNTNQANLDGELSFADVNATNRAMQFYRARLQ